MADFRKTEMTRFTADVELPTYIDDDGNKWVSNPDAARGYGYANGDPRQIDKMRTKTHADELIEGVHWVQVKHGVESTPSRGGPERVFWSLKGLIRLGNWVRTAQGAEFRDATEELWERELTGQPAVGAANSANEMTLAEAVHLINEAQAPILSVLASQRADLVQVQGKHEHLEQRVEVDVKQFARQTRRDIAEIKAHLGLSGQPAGPRSLEERITAHEFCLEGGLTTDHQFVVELGRLAKPIAVAANVEIKLVTRRTAQGISIKVQWLPRWVWIEALNESGYSLPA